MENTTIQNINRKYAFWIGALIACLIFWYISLSQSNTTPQKITLENKLTQLKDLRSDKAQKQKEIYLIDQKILPLKCSIFSEVSAKEQWNIECQDFYQEQQAKIKSTPAEPEQNDELDI